MNAGKYNVPTQISHVPQVTLETVPYGPPTLTVIYTLNSVFTGDLNFPYLRSSGPAKPAGTWRANRPE